MAREPSTIGPVTRAIRAVRAAPEPVEPSDPIADLSAALERFFLGAGTPVEFEAEIPAPKQGGAL